MICLRDASAFKLHLARVTEDISFEHNLLSENEISYCLKAGEPELQKARALLRLLTKKQLNDFTLEITQSSTGRPVVGAGYDVSYSHKKDWVVAALARHPQRVGVDIEFREALHANACSLFLNQFCTESDRQTADILMKKDNLSLSEALSLIFSIKEAYFKAQDQHFTTLQVEIIYAHHKDNIFYFNYYDRKYNFTSSETPLSSWLYDKHLISVCLLKAPLL